MEVIVANHVKKITLTRHWIVEAILFGELAELVFVRAQFRRPANVKDADKAK